MSMPSILRITGVQAPEGLNGIYYRVGNRYFSMETGWWDYDALDGWYWIGFMQGKFQPVAYASVTGDTIPTPEQWQFFPGANKGDLAYQIESVVVENEYEWSVMATSADTLSASYEQGRDLDFQDAIEYFCPLGDATTFFRGSYNGNGFQIRNLDYLGGNYVAIFGFAENARITNVHVRNCNFVCEAGSGGLVGELRYGNTVTDCSATGQISTTFNNVGGLIGRIWGSIVERCWTDVEITGGLVRDIVHIGGFVGRAAHTGSVRSLIKDCYALGKVSGGVRADYVGGFVGSVRQDPGLVFENCYARSDVSGRNYIGAFSGDDAHMVQNVFNCYWISNWAGSYSASGQRLSDAQARDPGSYTGWDFTTVWNRNDVLNNGFPYLDPRSAPAAQLPPGLFGKPRSFYRQRRPLHGRRTTFYKEPK